QHAPKAITDDEVTATLEQMREQQAEFRAVDRAAATGDLVVVDYTLRPDEHDPTTANGYHFVLGSGAVMPEIDAAADGMNAGEQRRRQGVDPDRVPWDVPKLVGELRPGAEQGVKRALLLEAIADKEGVVAGDDEVEGEVEKIARASQRPAPTVRRMMEKSGDLEALRLGLRERKTLDLLIEHATVRA